MFRFKTIKGRVSPRSVRVAMMKKQMNLDKDDNITMIDTNNKSIIGLNCTSSEEHITSLLISTLLKTHLEDLTAKEYSVFANVEAKNNFIATLRENYQVRLVCIAERARELYIIKEVPKPNIFESYRVSPVVIGYIAFSERNKLFNISSFSLSSISHVLEKHIETYFDKNKSNIDWVVDQYGGTIRIPLMGDKLPSKIMYPFIKDDTMEDYYQRFMDSDASILLLMGPPGTGKTSFIRGLLNYTSGSALFSYDTAVLEKDIIFSNFLENENNFMVLEDADTLLSSRSDGNNMMHRFLNVSDGLVTVRGKKMIFSTNLDNLSQVDAALLRPGRCFDILNFDYLTQEQSEKFCSEYNIDIQDKLKTRERWSIAELFNFSGEENKVKEPRRAGFY